MKDDTLLKFSDPAGISPDPLTDVLRKGARDLLAQAVEAEVCDLMAQHAHLTDAAGRARLVRHGHLPEREVMTGIGQGASGAGSGHGGREDQAHLDPSAAVSAPSKID